MLSAEEEYLQDTVNPAAYYVGPEMQALQTASSAVSRLVKDEVCSSFCTTTRQQEADLHQSNKTAALVPCHVLVVLQSPSGSSVQCGTYHESLNCLSNNPDAIHLEGAKGQCLVVLKQSHTFPLESVGHVWLGAPILTGVSLQAWAAGQRLPERLATSLQPLLDLRLVSRLLPGGSSAPGKYMRSIDTVVLPLSKTPCRQCTPVFLCSSGAPGIGCASCPEFC